MSAYEACASIQERKDLVGMWKDSYFRVSLCLSSHTVHLAANIEFKGKKVIGKKLSEGLYLLYGRMDYNQTLS